jgi:hypothetical protein
MRVQVFVVLAIICFTVSVVHSIQFKPQNCVYRTTSRTSQQNNVIGLAWSTSCKPNEFILNGGVRCYLNSGTPGSFSEMRENRPHPDDPIRSWLGTCDLLNGSGFLGVEVSVVCCKY